MKKNKVHVIFLILQYQFNRENTSLSIILGFIKKTMFHNQPTPVASGP